MRETNYSTGEANQPKGRNRFAWRIAILALAVVIALGCVVWIKEEIWSRMERLEDEFTTIESERFLLGLHARESVVRCNAALLRFQLSGDADERAKFYRVSRELNERLAAVGPKLTSAEERRLVREFEESFATYLKETAELAERPTRGIRRDTAAQLNEIIAEKSASIVALAEALTRAQRAAWNDFMSGSRGSLAALQKLQWTSVLALLAFIALITLLIFRTFVAPLRVELGRSRAVIAQQEQLASLGVLAAGVAHEIRNPLTAIKMRLYSFRKSLPATAQSNEDLAVVNSEINRLERIVKDTLQFARPANPQREVATVSELFSHVSALLGESLRQQGIQLQVEAPEDLPLHVDRQQMAQVLINLVQNAADSIEHEGSISLRARTGMARLGNNSQPAILLEVSDTGKGIPPEAEARIFDPFYSTRDGGTGLGLSIAARIVEKHGGVIQFSTQVDRGTTFSIVLPRNAPDERTHTAN